MWSGVLLAREPRRILILEDDRVLADLMASVLADAGYEPNVAVSPEAAEGTYDLVVADYLAPAFVPGEPWPHLDRLRHLSRGGPILGCTGHLDALAVSATSLGINAVATKPFDVDDLLKEIRRLLDEGTRVAQTPPVPRRGAGAGGNPARRLGPAERARLGMGTR